MEKCGYDESGGVSSDTTAAMLDTGRVTESMEDMKTFDVMLLMAGTLEGYVCYGNTNERGRYKTSHRTNSNLQWQLRSSLSNMLTSTVVEF